MFNGMYVSVYFFRIWNDNDYACGKIELLKDNHLLVAVETLFTMLLILVVLVATEADRSRSERSLHIGMTMFLAHIVLVCIVLPQYKLQNHCCQVSKSIHFLFSTYSLYTFLYKLPVPSKFSKTDLKFSFSRLFQI